MSQTEQAPLLGEGRSAPLITWTGLERHIPSYTDSNRRVRSQLQRFLTSKTGHYAVLLLVALDVSCIVADLIINLTICDLKRPSKGYTRALDTLGWVALVFSCLFMVELLASVWAFGFSFFRSMFHCFDALVIVAGFVIDVILHGVLEEVASLVVILRLWRVFKLMEEFSAGATEQMEDITRRMEMLQEDNDRLRAEIASLKPHDD